MMVLNAAVKGQESGDKKVDGEITPAVMDAERSALTFVAYDLDAHMAPATSRMEMHAKLSVRNDGAGAAAEDCDAGVVVSVRWERFVISGSEGAGDGGNVCATCGRYGRGPHWERAGGGGDAR